MPRRLAILPLIAAPLLAGCAGEPDFGQRLAAESGAVAAIGEDWREGDRAVERGRALIEEGRDEVAEGEDLLDSGRRKIRRGEALVEEGSDAKAGAEAAYQQRAERVSDG